MRDNGNSKDSTWQLFNGLGFLVVPPLVSPHGASERVRNCVMTAVGPSRHFAATQHFGRFRSEADINW